MNRSHQKLVRLILALCFAGVVGFGTNEAVAGELSPEGYCTFEDHSYCYEGCREVYGENYNGMCDFWYGIKMCTCWPMG